MMRGFDGEGSQRQSAGVLGPWRQMAEPIATGRWLLSTPAATLARQSMPTCHARSAVAGPDCGPVSAHPAGKAKKIKSSGLTCTGSRDALAPEPHAAQTGEETGLSFLAMKKQLAGRPRSEKSKLIHARSFSRSEASGDEDAAAWRDAR